MQPPQSPPPRANPAPGTLDYAKPAHSATLACALRTHLVVVVCGCCLAILHASWLATLSINHFYFPRREGTPQWDDRAQAVLSMPMSLLHRFGLDPQIDSMIAFCANSLLWGIGIAYLMHWLLRRLWHWMW